MEPNETVRVRAGGRAHLGKILSCDRKVRVKFLSSIPVIRGHKRRVQTFAVTDFSPWGKAGIDWILNYSDRN